MTRRVNLSRAGKGAWPSLITVTRVPLSKASNHPAAPVASRSDWG